MMLSMLSASVGLAVGMVFVGLAVGGVVGFVATWMATKRASARSEHSADKIIRKALDDAATEKKKAELEIKEETHKLRTQCEDEIRERRSEIQKTEQRVASREEQLIKREEILSNKELAVESSRAEVANTKKQCDKNLEEAKAKNTAAVEKLEKITGLTKAQAKKEIMDSLMDEARQEAADSVRKIVHDAQEDADKKSREVVARAMERLSTDVVSEVTVSTIPLPTDEIKGKIIGREGRNIRAIEAATGVDLIIDDTPEAIAISCFDPYRREVARLSIEKLIHDGRIHPGRIEEIVERVKKDLDIEIKKNGEEIIYDLKMHGVPSELVKLVGRYKYRTSYGQNLANHSKEVALLSRMMAEEMGADVNVCLRAGLFHDIGKVLDHEVEGTHVTIGVDLARRHKESEAVIHCIEAHHGDVPAKTVEAVIVQVADALSSARPGARRENLENYVKRLRDLEEIANSKPGVEKSFAISAGREIRIIVKPEQVDDAQAMFMAKEIAKEVEEKLQYPGQIKVNVIRESRATTFAK